MPFSYLSPSPFLLSPYNIDIKSDRSGCEDYEAQLKRLQMRKADLLKIIEENTEFCEEFDRQVSQCCLTDIYVYTHPTSHTHT
jgi:hypothetical protein